MKTVNLVCDLQFGSTGKGLYAGYLAKYVTKPTLLVTAWMPNAGHTYIDSDGTKYIHSMVPNGIVSPSVSDILMGPASVIDTQKLVKECTEASDKLVSSGIRGSEDYITVCIHENAGYVNERHTKTEEGSMFKIGSTMKGCGAVVIEKIKRDPDCSPLIKDIREEIEGVYGLFHIEIVEHRRYLEQFKFHDSILIEGAQGYSLGINSGIWPYCTSRECTPQQIFSDCAIPRDIARICEVHGVMRTFPIRVANRYDANGNKIGTSGPGYPDQEEITWDSIGLMPELTTVTKLPRRIFTFSKQQFYEAYLHTRPDMLFLNFANYLPFNELMSLIDTMVDVMISIRGAKCGDHIPLILGFGPHVKDLFAISVTILSDGRKRISNIERVIL